MIYGVGEFIEPTGDFIEKTGDFFIEILPFRGDGDAEEGFALKFVVFNLNLRLIEGAGVAI